MIAGAWTCIKKWFISYLLAFKENTKYFSWKKKKNTTKQNTHSCSLIYDLFSSRDFSFIALYPLFSIFPRPKRQSGHCDYLICAVVVDICLQKNQTNQKREEKVDTLELKSSVDIPTRYSSVRHTLAYTHRPKPVVSAPTGQSDAADVFISSIRGGVRLPGNEYWAFVPPHVYCG